MCTSMAAETPLLKDFLCLLKLMRDLTPSLIYRRTALSTTDALSAVNAGVSGGGMLGYAGRYSIPDAKGDDMSRQ